MAQQHQAWHNNTRHGTTTIGMAQQHQAWHNNNRHGTTTIGMAQQHQAWHNNTRHGTTTIAHKIFYKTEQTAKLCAPSPRRPDLDQQGLAFSVKERRA
uniref:Uncharacterized protein n=1 Tax=Globodera rostochiensis TaxID=31243 RepID=A0A914GR84_GLORO